MQENNKKPLIRKQHFLFWFVGVFLLGAASVFVINYFTNLPSVADTEIRLNNSSYKYINPLLDCNTGNGISSGLRTFQNNVQDEIDRLTASKQIDFAALYFRDMNNGPFFDMNGSQPFFPASLLKVPLMIAYYKESESNPDILNKKITYTQVLDTDTEHFQAPTIVVGQTYTIEQLIEAMIENSDNNAYELLLQNIDSNALSDVFSYLGVTVPTDQIVLTVRQYSTFFRILFNSSYLDYSDSEHAMELLDNIYFQNGLQAGVPSNIQVVNKFGEKWDGVTSDEKQLHDCGIIYYPDHPYLLCVMTRGNDFDQLASAIADISKFVYNQVDAQLKQNN